MNSVSRLTSALLCNSARLNTRKAERARAEGTLVVRETTLLTLLEDVQPGDPKTSTRARPTRPTRPTRTIADPAGPLAGHRVLVLGGTHQHAAEVRAEVIAGGGAAAVNLSANVTDLILLDGGEHDHRLPRAIAAAIQVHRGPIALGITLPTATSVTADPGRDETDDPAPAEPQPPVEVDPAADSPQHSWDLGSLPAPIAIPILARGTVIDLPSERVWTTNVAWRADALATGTELDVVAFLVDEAERVITDEDFVFYNAPVSQDGAVTLSIDGDSEQSIRVDLDLIGEHYTRVIIAAALTGDCTFGDLGVVTLSVDGQRATAATATLDAGTSERTMLLSEIYRRGEQWRVRAIGQGYDDGLAELATRYGVVVD